MLKTYVSPDFESVQPRTGKRRKIVLRKGDFSSLYLVKTAVNKFVVQAEICHREDGFVRVVPAYVALRIFFVSNIGDCDRLELYVRRADVQPEFSA